MNVFLLQFKPGLLATCLAALSSEIEGDPLPNKMGHNAPIMSFASSAKSVEDLLSRSSYIRADIVNVGQTTY